MKAQNDELNLIGNQINNKEENLPGYPVYPDEEDIYRNFVEEEEINPEDTSKTKVPVSTDEPDLDIPGVELDDAQEEIGSEDEENNYYSLGGDHHKDLEEYQEE